MTHDTEERCRECGNTNGEHVPHCSKTSRYDKYPIHATEPTTPPEATEWRIVEEGPTLIDSPCHFVGCAFEAYGSRVPITNGYRESQRCVNCGRTQEIEFTVGTCAADEQAPPEAEEATHVRWEEGQPHESHRWVWQNIRLDSGEWRSSSVCGDCHHDMEHDEALEPCAPPPATPVQADEVDWRHPWIATITALQQEAHVERVAAKYQTAQSLELEAKLDTAREERDALRKFFEMMARDVWDIEPGDGGDFQDAAEKLGLIVRVPADEAFREEYGGDEMLTWAWNPLAQQIGEKE